MSKFHYFKEQKLDPPIRPFIRLLNWRVWGVRIGRYEFGIRKPARND